MVPELYLIAPPDAAIEPFAETLKRVMAITPIAALLLPRGTRTDAAYQAFVREIAFIGQEAGSAVLLEGKPRLAAALGVDGLHATGTAAEIKAALTALKPDLIVGAGMIATRDEAMTLGELGVDYIMFGPLSGAIAPETREMAEWWAQTMEIPSVLSDPEATPETASAAGCEFLGLSDSVWRSADPAATLAAIIAGLEARG